MRGNQNKKRVEQFKRETHADRRQFSVSENGKYFKNKFNLQLGPSSDLRRRLADD